MDNITNIEPADNEERLLKGILEGDTETNIEPAGNKERLLKGILENLGGGGGGGGATSVTLAASGDNLSGDITLADLKTALSSGVVLLSFPTDGNADERVVAEYTDDSTNGLRIGVFSEDEYIVYSVVDDGSDGVTLTVVSEKGIGSYTATADSSIALAIQGAFTAVVPLMIQNPNTIQIAGQGVDDYTGNVIKHLVTKCQKGYSGYIDGDYLGILTVAQAVQNDNIYSITIHINTQQMTPMGSMWIIADIFLVEDTANETINASIVGIGRLDSQV